MQDLGVSRTDYCRKITPTLSSGKKKLPQTDMDQISFTTNFGNKYLTHKPPSAPKIRLKHPSGKDNYMSKFHHLTQEKKIFPNSGNLNATKNTLHTCKNKGI